MRLRENKWLGLIFGLFICGMFMLGGVVLIATDLLRLATYERVEARVISRIAPDADASDEALRAGRVEYRYRVDGIEYKGRFPRKEWIDIARLGDGIIATITADQNVDAWYDPNEPSESTLWLGVEPFPLALLLIVTPFVAVVIRGAGKGNLHSLAGGAYVIYVFGSFAIGFGLAGMSRRLGWVATDLLLLAVWVLWPAVVFGTARRWVRQARRREAATATVRAQFEAWGMAVATLLWCVVTGIFVIDAWGTPIRTWMAQGRYRAVEAEVARSWKLQRNKSTHAKVEFIYRVDGREYRSRRVDLGLYPMSLGSDGADKFVAAHPPGRKLTAYYNPADPSRAALRLTVSPLRWLGAVLMVPFVVVGVYGIVTTMRWFRSLGTEEEEAV